MTAPDSVDINGSPALTGDAVTLECLAEFDSFFKASDFP